MTTLSKEEFSIFDEKFLKDIAAMEHKNIAVEILKKLIAEQISVYKGRKLVNSKKFSELMQRVINSYLNGMFTNEQVIDELLKMAALIKEAKQRGDDLGLNEEEMAFYDALSKPDAVKEFYTNEQLAELTKELADTLRKNRTIDWQQRKAARAKMRMLVKRLLKKYKYPPEGEEEALETVLAQCETWTDNAA